jgi:hypothetical protein
MAKDKGEPIRFRSEHAKREDFKRILGELEEPTLIALLEIDPNIEQLEEAAICLAGDQDVLAKSGHHVSSKASRVVELITAIEEQEVAVRR